MKRNETKRGDVRLMGWCESDGKDGREEAGRGMKEGRGRDGRG